MTTTEAAADDAPARTRTASPVKPDMWFFVFFESLIFTSYFCVYLYVPHPERAGLPPRPSPTSCCGSASSTPSSC